MKLTEMLDMARERAGISSDTRLAAAVGVHQTAVVQWRRGTATPTPSKLVRLAELAGVSPAVALLHRASWQADDQASRDVMSRILASWHEATSPNPLKEPQSLGAAAAPRLPKPVAFDILCKVVALWAALWDMTSSADHFALAAQ